MIANSLILSFFFFIRAASSAPDKCLKSSCDASQPQVQFPFRLNGVQPDQCRGYPGFDLSCDNARFTMLRFSNTPFRVQHIDYVNQQIWLNDPNHCLPRLLLTLNLSNTPFRSVYLQELALFNCSSKSSIPFGLDPVTCLGDTVFAAAASDSAARAGCARVGNVSVPAVWPWNGDDGRTNVVPEDIRLTWDDPRCGGCEARGGVCGLKPNSDRDIECSLPGELSKHIQGVTTIVLVLVFIIGLFCAANACRLNSGRFNATLYPWLELNSTTANIPRPGTGNSGLDPATIESFPITVLGESIRMSRTENNVCAICLGEYRPQETLRTIPACHHFFHSSCIDEWLLRNSTCPICRESQKLSPESARAPEP